MVGGVGQRMLTSVSRRMAVEFFGNVDAVLGGAAPSVAAPVSPAPAAGGAEPAVGAVFTAPAAPASSQDDFLRGVAVGAGLVLAGVLAGALVGRRR